MDPLNGVCNVCIAPAENIVQLAPGINILELIQQQIQLVLTVFMKLAEW
jgi:hypothetical protein